MAALPLGEVQARRATLIRLFDRSLLTGMAHETVEGTAKPAHFREAQRFDASAELALLAAISACSVALIEKTVGRPVEERRLIVQSAPVWPDHAQDWQTGAWDLIRRLEAGSSFDPIVRQCMHGIDLAQQVIRTDLAKARWVFASAKSVNLRDADLSHAFLIFADLSHAFLRRARGLMHKQLEAARNVNWERVPDDLPDE